MTEDNFYRLETENSRLVIKTGLTPRFFASWGLGRLNSQPGLILNGSRKSSWLLEGSFEENGFMCFYGPEIKINEKPDFGSLEIKDSLKIMMSCIDVFEMFQERDIEMAYYSFAIRSTEEENLFLLPPLLAQRMSEGLAREQWDESGLRYRLPLFSGEEDYLFTLSMMCQHSFTGALPYRDEPRENWHYKVRYKKYLPPQGMPRTMADLISASLKPGNKKPSLSDWREAIQSWSEQSGLKSVREISPDQQKKEEQAEKNWARRVWFRKHRTALGIGLATLVLFGFMAAGPISNALEPPLTTGFSPEMVVEAYYASFNALDESLLSDCIDEETGKADINELTHVFVISRVRLGTERSTGLVNAETWWTDGKPELPENHSVYGVANLKIEKLSETEFRAEYLKYSPTAQDEEDNLIPDYYVQRVDRLTLSETDKGNWIISDLKREETAAEGLK